jgi:hypothetical protein
MAVTDLILFPIYVLLFYLFYAAKRKKITDPVLKKYYLQGFWIKVVGTIAFTVFNLFISKGDSILLYYEEGINITRLILKDASNIKWIFTIGKNFDQNLLSNTFNKGYLLSESNYFVTRLVAVFAFFTFGSYAVINLFFSFISFSGVWRLFKFFYEQYPHLHKKFAVAIIYLPTLVFWCSGILKDPVCMGMLGFMTYALYKASLKREAIFKNILVAIVSATIVGILKPYILFAYLPFFIIFIVLFSFKIIKKRATKLVLVCSLFLLAFAGSTILADRLKEELGDLALDKLNESVKNTQGSFINMADLAASSFSLGVDFDGSTTSFLKMAPAAITATLYRPYLWESKKISTLLSSLESLAMMLFTLYVFVKIGPFVLLGGIIKDPMIFYCFSFAILFAIFVGATTLNFGTLVRYKIPCLPFYIISFILLLERGKKMKASKKLAKENTLKAEV